MSLRPAVAGAATAVAALLAGLPAAPAGAATTVRDDASAQAMLTAYDPADTLRLPGDAHRLLLRANRYAGEQHVTVEAEHYTCGPHDPLDRPLDTLCTSRGDDIFEGRDPRVDVVADDTVRVRATTPAGALDVTLTGAVGDPFLAYDLRRSEGTRGETGRGVERNGPAAPTSATLAGVTLRQPRELRTSGTVQILRLTTSVTTVPAVPVPRLEPVGTASGAATTVGEASVNWSRRLPSLGPRGTLDVEIGRLTYQQLAPWAHVAVDVQRQRCRAGQRLRPPVGRVPDNPCAALGPRFGAESSNAVADSGNGRLHVVVDLPPKGHRPAARIDLTVLGRDPVGFTQVERRRGSVTHRWLGSDRTGVRWAGLRVTGTIGGKAPNRLWDADFEVRRQQPPTGDPAP